MVKSGAGVMTSRRCPRTGIPDCQFMSWLLGSKHATWQGRRTTGERAVQKLHLWPARPEPEVLPSQVSVKSSLESHSGRARRKSSVISEET